MNPLYPEGTSAQAVMLKGEMDMKTEEEKLKKSKMKESGEKGGDEEKTKM
jgi:hypothetical protein